MSEQQNTVNRLYASAMMLIPNLLPHKLTLAGIDDLYLRLGADKAWLEKGGGPRLWEGDKQHRVRKWMEGINNYRPDLTFPIAVEVLTILADTNPSLPAKERRIAVELASKIKVHLGVAAAQTTAHYFDQRISDVVRDAYLAGSYTEAVRRAYVEVINEVKKRAGTQGLDGIALMNRVFSKDRAILKVSDDPDQQEGCMNLFKGAVSMIRNPPSHSNEVKLDKNEADELLWFATYLLRILDGSTKLSPQPGSSIV